ncbi:MAG TPA: Shedu anti-phage system protein SduA domain-containing protein [archaeon]|nr:Shedu anti-phage system protein SduA domain-containing protein [archaeon]
MISEVGLSKLRSRNDRGFEMGYMHACIDRGIKKIFPKKSFGGEGFPDFIAVLHDLTHILVEIEKPTDKMYTKRGHPSAKFSLAEQQIRDYLQWANEEKEFLRKRGLPDISVENTKGLLIIGMKKNLSIKEKERLAQQNFSSRSHEIKTFDDILMENEKVIANIRKFAKRRRI